MSLQLVDVPRREAPAERIDAPYEYLGTAAGPGELAYETRLDLDADGLDDRLAAHTRWIADGAGRADVAALASAYPDATVQASECRAADFLRSYFADTFGGTTEGDEATGCVHPTAAYPTLAP